MAFLGNGPTASCLCEHSQSAPRLVWLCASGRKEAPGDYLVVLGQPRRGREGNWESKVRSMAMPVSSQGSAGCKVPTEDGL